MDPNLPISDVKTMDQLEERIAGWRPFHRRAFGGF